MKTLNFFTGLGFLFRIFVIFWLFLWGFRGLHNWIGHSLFIEIISATEIFLSIYLLFNLFSKKVTEQTYGNWSVAAIIFLIVIALAYVFAVFSVGHILPFSSETIFFGLKVIE